MIKKITLILILICFVVSCGKKSDPKYKSSQKDILIKNVSIKTT